MSDDDAPRPRRPLLRSSVRRGIFVVTLAALVGANAWMVRRQYPASETRKNQAYDAGLRALDGRDFAGAETSFLRFLEVEPGNRRVRHLLAIALDAQGKVEEARRAYAEILAQDPEDDEARVGLAGIALREQDYEAALEQLRQAREKLPTPTVAWVLEAKIHQELGNFEGAIQAYQTAVRRDPGSYTSFVALGDLHLTRSLVLRRVEDTQAAAGWYRSAEEACRTRLGGADDDVVRVHLARALAGQARTSGDRQLSEAVEQIRIVAAKDGDDPGPTLLLARLFQESGNREEARRAYEDAARRWKVPETAGALHEFLAASGQTDAAVRALTEAIDVHRENVSLRVRLIAFYVRAGRLDDARTELGSMVDLLSADFRVHEVKGDLARELARRAEASGDDPAAREHRATALAAYRRALELRPRAPRLQKKFAGEMVEGLLRRKPGDDPTDDERRARECIESVLRVNAGDVEAVEWRAQLLIVDGRTRDAYTLLEPVLRSPDATVSALRLLGVAASRIGSDEVASQAFTRVLDLLSPRDAAEKRDGRLAPPEDWRNAVDAALRAGRPEVAARLGREARAAWPEVPGLRASLAAVHVARGDGTAARLELVEARKEFPGDAALRLLLAQAFELEGKLDLAEEEYRSAIADVGGDEPRLRYFDFLARTGRLASAEEGFLAMVASEPTNPLGHLRLGDFYLASKPPRRDAALQSYEKARALAPNDAAPVFRLAELRFQDVEADPTAVVAAEGLVRSHRELAPDAPENDYLEGKLALGSGRPADAVTSLERFRTARPDSSAGLFYLARALHAAGRGADALEPLDRAVRLAPGNESLRVELGRLLYQLGLEAFRRGDFDGARSLLARASAAGGAAGDAGFLGAGAAANLGRLDVAETECRALLETSPDDRATMYLLAAILLRTAREGAADEAEALYRRALKIDPEDLLAQVGIASVKAQKGLFADALAAYRQVYPRTNGDPTMALAIAQCLGMLDDAKGAVDFLEAEAAAHPQSSAFPHMRGDFLMGLRLYDAAVESFLQAVRIDPDNQVALLAAAAAHLAARRPDDARKLLSERLATSKDPAPVHVALGDVLLRTGREAEGRDELRRALALQPGHTRALVLLGRLAEKDGKSDDARRLYREAVTRGTFEVDAYVRLARLLAAEGDRDGATDLYRTALRFEPRSTVVLNGLALLLGEDAARLDEAVRIAQAAWKIAPDRPEVGDTYGWLLFRKGAFAEAVSVLAVTAAALPESAEAQFHAGMAFARQRKTAEARMHLERALRIDPKFPGADAARMEVEALK